MKQLGSNKYYIEGEHIDTSYTKYLASKRSEDAIAFFEEDEAEEIATEGRGLTEPIGPTFIKAADQPVAATDTVAETVDKERDDDPEATMIGRAVGIEYDLADAVIRAARSNITSSNISWKRAVSRYGHAGYYAMEKIYRELRQIVIEYDV